MKKLILAIGLGLALNVSAQQHNTQSFLAPYSVTVSNTLALTNIAFPQIPVRTNVVGLRYTNTPPTAPTQVSVVVTGAPASTVQLCKTVSLWVDRNGNPAGIPFLTNNIAAASQFTPVFSQITVGLTGTNAAANSDVTFTFAPVPGSGSDGSTPDLATAPIGGNEWSFSVLAVGATPVQIITNVPTWLWPGCKGLALKRIVNTDTSADSSVTVYNLALHGFIP